MKTPAHQQFGMLCEALIREASDTLNMIGQDGGKAAIKLVQYLHKEMRLPHDFNDYRQVDRINWSLIKDQNSGYGRNTKQRMWIILIGVYGSAAIVPTTGYSQREVEYRTFTCDNEGNIEKQTFSRSSDAMNFTKAVTNRIKSIYIGQGTAVPEKEKYVDPKERGITIEELIKRFAPSFQKVVTQAVADIKGMVINQIKNDAYDKIQKKISRLQALQNLQDNLLDRNYNSSEDAILKQVLRQAIATTASHYYPEQTGNITPGYGGTMNVQRSYGMDQIAKDISAGDMKKLAMVFYYLKRELVAA